MKRAIHVLFIEDNLGDARLVQEELRSAPSKTMVELEWVDRLEKGLERLASNHLDAVLIDLDLPDSQGLDTLRRVLAHAPQIPVIVITGQADEEAGIQAVQVGAQDYLIKGQVDGRLLLRSIQYAVQRKQAEMQLADALAFTEHMLTSSPVGILTYRLSGECMSANAYVAEMVGATVEQLKKQNFHEIESWKRSGLNDMAEQAIASKKLIAADVHVITTFGKDLWVRAQFVTFRSGGEELLLLTFLDITERKRAENALRGSEEDFRQLFEAESDAIFLIENQSGQILLANHTACVLYGYSREELLTKRNTDLSAEPEQTRQVTTETPILLEQVITVPLRYHRKKDGTVFPVEITGRFFLHQGRPVHIAAIRDITERKQVEAALAASEARYRNLFESNPHPMWVYDVETLRFLAVNDAAVEHYGYSREEFLSMTIREIRPAEDVPALIENVRQNEGVLHTAAAWRHLKKDQTLIDVEITSHALQWESTSARLVLANDITERRRAEIALRDSEARYRTIMERSVEAIYLYELSAKRVVVANPAFLDLLGYSLEEACTLTLYDIVAHDRDSIDTFLDQILSQGGISMGERLWRKKDGTTVPVEVTANKLQQSGGDLVFVVARDITERKHLEEQLRQNDATLRGFYESAPSLMGITELVGDDDILHVYDNPATCLFFGAPKDATMGRLSSELGAPPSTIHEWVRHYRESERTGSPVHFEYLHENGKHPRWLAVTVAVIGQNATAHTRFCYVAEEITERRQAQIALQEKEHLLSEAQRIGHIGSWSYYIPTDTLQYSDEMYRLLDISPESFEHNNEAFLDLVYSSDRPLVAKWMEGIRVRGQAKEVEFLVLCRNGELRYIRCQGGVEFDKSGKPVRFIGTAQDVTERKLAEIQIRQQIERLTALSTIDRAITSSFDLHVTLDVLLSQAIAQLQVDASAVLLLDPDMQLLEYVAWKGFSTQAVEGACLRVAGSQAGRAVRERRAIYIENLENKPEDKFLMSLRTVEDFTSYVGLPVIVKGKVKGVLELFHRAPLHPYPEWLDFLQTLAGQAPIALENAQLFENLQHTNEELVQAYDATIEGWSRAMDLRDRETEGHTQRVTSMTVTLAQRMGIDEAQLMHMRRGALLHDIGKLGIPDQILHKRDELSEEEWEIMRKHPQFAYQMLSSIPYLKPALDIPYCHHEKWDGTGYPRGLKGADIPLAARIFAIVDVWDALRSDRPYRKAWTMEQAREYIREQAGTHFDPMVVEQFLDMITE